jgi:hypothetical protein
MYHEYSSVLKVNHIYRDPKTLRIFIITNIEQSYSHYISAKSTYYMIRYLDNNSSHKVHQTALILLDCEEIQ